MPSRCEGAEVKVIEVMDNTMEQIEELTMRLKSIYKGQLIVPLEQEIEEKIIKLRDQIMMSEEIIHLLLDTQKFLQNIDALFSHRYVSKALSEDLNTYKEIRKEFQKITNQLNDRSTVGFLIEN